MARRPKHEPVPHVRVDPVRRVVVEARRLILVAPTDPVWAALQGQADPPAKTEDQVGAIVQVRPPADATELEIANVAGLYQGRGAAVVDVLPKEPGGEVMVRRMRAEQRAGVTPRELVLGMADKSVSANRDGLRALLATVLDEEGL